MSWLILGVICVVFSAVALVTWRMWIAPWGKLEEILGQISRGKAPRTFLIDGAAESRRAGLALENLFARQQELDQQITQRESGTQTILRAMHDGLLVVDERRHIMLMNRTFEKLFELRDGAVGAPLLETIRHATLDRLIAEALRTGNALQRELTLTDSQTNAGRHVEISAVPMKDDAGLTTGAVVICHDITELKRLDQIRRDFVANVSHELRTPLSILRGYIEMLLDNPKTSREELPRILAIMDRHSKRLGRLVDDLLSLAHLESSNASLELHTVRIEDLFNNVIRDWKEKLAAKNLKVVVDLAPDASTLRA